MLSSPLWTEWWVWLSAAMFLAILEVLIPAFVFLGFAVGAAAIGLLLWLGLLNVSAAVSLVAFAVTSLIAYAILRVVFGRYKDQVKRIDHDINEN
jgi:inner membrane protein